MSKSKNPFGLRDVTPYLLISDIERLIPFLETVFDARLRGEVKYRGDGSVMHVEVTIGDSVVMMGEPPDHFDAMPSTLYVYVDNCDKTYQKALDHGGESVADPTDYPHGDRYGGIRDSSGNIWWIVTHLKSESNG